MCDDFDAPKERVISQSQLRDMVRGSLDFLQRHGFTYERDLYPHPEIRDIFENWFKFHGRVAPEEKQLVLVERPADLTQAKLDKLTLLCAQLYIKHDVDDMHYNECLNGVRAALVDTLKFMGYEVPRSIHNNQRWQCYWFWEKIAHDCGRTDEQIAESRAWAKERWPEHYQATAEQWSQI